MNTITPEQALENLARIADAALLNGPDRRATNESIRVLMEIITPKPAAPAPSA